MQVSGWQFWSSEVLLRDQSLRLERAELVAKRDHLAKPWLSKALPWAIAGHGTLMPMGILSKARAVAVYGVAWDIAKMG